MNIFIWHGFEPPRFLGLFPLRRALGGASASPERIGRRLSARSQHIFSLIREPGLFPKEGKRRFFFLALDKSNSTQMNRVPRIGITKRVRSLGQFRGPLFRTRPFGDVLAARCSASPGSKDRFREYALFGECWGGSEYDVGPNSAGGGNVTRVPGSETQAWT